MTQNFVRSAQGILHMACRYCNTASESEPVKSAQTATASIRYLSRLRCRLSLVAGQLLCWMCPEQPKKPFHWRLNNCWWPGIVPSVDGRTDCSVLEKDVHKSHFKIEMTLLRRACTCDSIETVSVSRIQTIKSCRPAGSLSYSPLHYIAMHFSDVGQLNAVQQVISISIYFVQKTITVQ